MLSKKKQKVTIRRKLKQRLRKASLRAQKEKKQTQEMKVTQIHTNETKRETKMMAAESETRDLRVVVAVAASGENIRLITHLLLPAMVVEVATIVVVAVVMRVVVADIQVEGVASVEDKAVLYFPLLACEDAEQGQRSKTAGAVFPFKPEASSVVLLLNETSS